MSEEIQVGDLVVYISSGCYAVVQSLRDGVILGRWAFTPEDAHRAGTQPIPEDTHSNVRPEDCRLISRGARLEQTAKSCTCTSMDLFRAGCRCGAVKPYKASWA